MPGILIIVISMPFLPLFAFLTPFSRSVRSAPTLDLDTLFYAFCFSREHLVRPPMEVTGGGGGRGGGRGNPSVTSLREFKSKWWQVLNNSRYVLYMQVLVSGHERKERNVVRN